MVTILFDLEGTLVQSIENDEEAIFDFRIKTREKLLELGIPQSELRDVATSTLTMRNKALDYVEIHFTEQEARKFHLEMDRFMKTFELSWARNSKIFPDTIPALMKLREHGYRMGIITNTSKEAANLELSIHKIKEYFDVVITRENVKKLKPDPEGILLALKILGEIDFFFVGDLIYDLKATQKAGGKCIMVNRTSNLKVHADYLVKSLIQIPILIQHARSNNC